MSQPFKVCARCGQRAVLQMVQCGRCGQPFPQQAPPGATSPVYSAATQRELARAAPVPTRKRSLVPLVALLALLAVVAFGANMVVQNAQDVLERVGPAVTGSTSAESPVPRDLTSGLFHERPSGAEKPTIVLGNGADAPLTLVLRGEDGREYSATCDPGREARVQVPAGHYTLTISSTAPWIVPNHGDATFRRFKEYDAFFVLDDEAPPIHLGD